MAKGLTIEIENVGPVLFEKSSRARRLNISVRPFKGIRVAVPCSLSIGQAEKFAREKSGWMEMQLARMRRVEEEITIARSKAVPINRVKAEEQLTVRLSELAERFGFMYNKVTIRNQKTRWGSCSANGNISLNMNLVALPAELIDYVLLHELMHLKVRNHSAVFWSELQSLMPDARERAYRLKKHRIAEPL